jgi:hypothetical protein
VSLGLISLSFGEETGGESDGIFPQLERNRQRGTPTINVDTRVRLDPSNSNNAFKVRI